MKISLVISVEETSFAAVAAQADWARAIERAAALGYDGVELAVRDPQAVDADALWERTRQAGLTVPALGTGQAYLADGLSLTARDPGIRRRAVERLRAHLDLAARWGALVIVGLVRGRIEDGRESADRRLEEALQRLLPDAERLGVRLAIEPINRYETDYLATVGEVLQLLDRVRSPRVGVLADTFHMNIEEVSIEDALRHGRDRLFHVHVADSNRRAPGWGHLDFRRILGVLEEIGYGGFLSAEILPLPDPEQAAAQAVRYLRALRATAPS
ncbi:MAG: 5-keto-L-gluconate epimerase [Armatimonadota bacterium]|nr:5-keto-L-gluconate epimerase [Armatimonadota bacterium]MDR7404372.1 5-keto-L-gluconate epimerase [Armatimonadota bacterium]MDR7437306.1 5-keto-L-gluconate epimerase [Armatimonadota bacterium]MDR7472645.1 5-keto-L-gluconate epimerase [Armatimonadota bacterium]MDR7509066.1 5-keto-L-gluconate epimerase [Armatimonadota bacterium]